MFDLLHLALPPLMRTRSASSVSTSTSISSPGAMTARSSLLLLSSSGWIPQTPKSTLSAPMLSPPSSATSVSTAASSPDRDYFSLAPSALAAKFPAPTSSAMASATPHASSLRSAHASILSNALLSVTSASSSSSSSSSYSGTSASILHPTATAASTAFPSWPMRDSLSPSPAIACPAPPARLSTSSTTLPGEEETYAQQQQQQKYSYHGSLYVSDDDLLALSFPPLVLGPTYADDYDATTGTVVTGLGISWSATKQPSVVIVQPGDGRRSRRLPPPPSAAACTTPSHGKRKRSRGASASRAGGKRALGVIRE